MSTFQHTQQTTIKHLLSESKTLIAQKLQKIINETANDFDTVSILSQDLKTILLPLALSGKMIRGSLVWYMYHFITEVDPYSQQLSKEHILTVAAAFELIQAGLLIHDDIMDRDVLRRGMPTVHVQYQERYKHATTNESIGEHMAICLGDESLFLAMGILAQIPDPYAAKVIRFVVPQLVKTGIGQSQDVLGASISAITNEEIETIYLHKTAAYTFTIPLSAGVILANRTDTIPLPQIASLGESLGLLFQLRDDYLGIFGDPKETGKNTFTDISENKKTLIRTEILAQTKIDNQEEWFNSIFGNQSLTPKDVLSVRRYIEKTGILDKIDSDMNYHHDQALEKIEKLSISKEGRYFFKELVMYLRHRSV